MASDAKSISPPLRWLAAFVAIAMLPACSYHSQYIPPPDGRPRVAWEGSDLEIRTSGGCAGSGGDWVAYDSPGGGGSTVDWTVWGQSTYPAGGHGHGGPRPGYRPASPSVGRAGGYRAAPPSIGHAASGSSGGGHSGGSKGGSSGGHSGGSSGGGDSGKAAAALIVLALLVIPIITVAVAGNSPGGVDSVNALDEVNQRNEAIRTGVAACAGGAP